MIANFRAKILKIYPSENINCDLKNNMLKPL